MANPTINTIKQEGRLVREHVTTELSEMRDELAKTNRIDLLLEMVGAQREIVAAQETIAKQTAAAEKRIVEAVRGRGYIMMFWGAAVFLLGFLVRTLIGI